MVLGEGDARSPSHTSPAFAFAYTIRSTAGYVADSDRGMARRSRGSAAPRRGTELTRQYGEQLRLLLLSQEG